MRHSLRIYEAFRDDPRKARALAAAIGDFERRFEPLADVVTRPYLHAQFVQFEARLDQRFTRFEEELREDFRRDFESLRADMQAGDQSLREEMQAGDQLLREEMRAGDQSLREEMQLLRADMQAGDQSLREEIRSVERSLGERIQGVELLSYRLYSRGLLWSFVFWITQLSAMAGLGYGLLELLGK